MRFVTITSGKGGVGKSTLAANISYLLSIYGYKTAIFDADVGLANQDIIFNVKPQNTILDVLKGDANFEDIVVQLNNNLYLIPGENGEEIFQYKNSDILEKFFAGVEKFNDFDFLIIDTGAGIGEYVQSFIKAATDTIVVTIPDPSAIMDAYSMIKYTLKVKSEIYLVVNRTKSAKEAHEIFVKLESVAKKHIDPNAHIEFLGYVEKSNLIEEASKRREIVVQSYASSIPAIEIANIVKKLTNSLTKDGEHIKETPNIAIFFKRLLQQI
ncbi:flagellar biosynthesis protein FlhG [Nitratiruptor sp. YY08-26]|uniref:P-loop NTPase n=1 Tax=unclassified Nitratiruptor TaxID=2624044 RepID=UPI001914E0EC|nr:MULTISPECIES: P-loop NTPase [unclassified Nitratiruptor]BCD61620.1 flagellar biosynthesis protein FlhG [Nitratiruptor sp. YY08-13]BCD65554.1 flagellar biosynthesis protein FlhG [Nitratiruptor sp. YY08-26]